jgi:hypothetical protein
LEVHKTVGVDNVHPKVLKMCSISLCKPLSLIFNKSYESGVVPDLWRKADIVPLFKKGCKLEPSNYRPISLTSIVCKLMERIIRDEIMNYLLLNKLIIEQQLGFVNNKNGTTNLLETFDFITKALADGYNVDEILLDFAKAFDSVLSIRLCLKLDNLGNRNKLLAWCKSFLSGRSQRVIIGEFMSAWEEILSGVPQGSVLGPLLFIIFITDLLQRIKNEGKLFADDTKLLAIIKSGIDNKSLQNDLNVLKDWTEDWQIKFNSLKCKVMHFGKSNPKHKYTIDEVILEELKVEKDLGIFISNDIDWSHHINYAINKANKQLGRIKHAFKFIDESIMSLLYKSLVRPHLEYGAVIWNSQWQGEIDMLENVQYRATKISSLNGFTREERNLALNLPTLENRRRRGDLIQMFKLVKNIDVINLHNQIRFFNVDGSTRGHTLRIHRELLNTQNNCKYNTIRHNFFTNRVVNDWNSLSQEAVGSQSVNQFKNHIDKLLKF